MSVARETLINYFADKLDLEPTRLQELLNRPCDEYYDIEYYLTMAYGWHKISYEIIRELFLSCVPRTVSTAVDIGCGPGLYRKLVLERARHYIGIDISESAIELAKHIYSDRKNTRFIQADASNVDVLRRSADLVFCTEVIEHISPLVPLFENIHRMLKQNGKLFLTTTTFYYYIAHVLILFGYKDIYKNSDFSKFFHRLKLYFGGFKGSKERTLFMKEGLEREDHMHAFTYGQLQKVFSETRFKIEQYIYFNCKDIFLGSELFLPLNYLLKKLFRTSRIYGPNIAVLLARK